MLLETASAVVLLLLIVSGIVDIGRMIHSYVLVTQAATEAVRLGIRVRGLPVGSYSSDAGEIPPEHDEILRRAVLILDRYPELALRDIVVTSSYGEGGDAGLVSVQISGAYNAFFPLFSGVSILGSQASEYLQ